MANDTDSRWRRTARGIITRTISKHPELVSKDGLPSLFKIVSKAYPWGERKMHPYKMWCKEVSIARRRLERDVGLVERNPYYVKCDACGAHPGFECYPIGSIVDDFDVANDAELEGRTEDAAKIRKTAFHEARLIAVGLMPSKDQMSLFTRSA